MLYMYCHFIIKNYNKEKGLCVKLPNCQYFHFQPKTVVTIAPCLLVMIETNFIMETNMLGVW